MSVSSHWLGLDRLVGKLRPHVVAAQRPDRSEMTRDEQKFKASAIALAFMSETGNQDAENVVGIVNVSMLALTSNAQPPVWLCRPSASRVVHATDLRSIPTLPPKALRRSGVVEARRPETGERLWGDVASLGWYSLGDTWWLLGLSYPDGLKVVRWSPKWTGADLDEQLPPLDPSALVAKDQQDAYYDFAFEAARYLVVFGLLAETDPSPLRIVLDKRDTTKRRSDVYLDDRHSPKRSASPVPLLEGRFGVDISITGHLKRQRFGEGLKQTKWIYVQGFSARRWVSPRWLVSEYGSGEIS